MLRWIRWHCPWDTGFDIRALAVWDPARYLSVVEASHNTESLCVRGEETFVSLKLECHSRVRTRVLRLSKQSALTTAPGPPFFYAQKKTVCRWQSLLSNILSYMGHTAQQKHKLFTWCWFNDLTLNQHWGNVSCLLGGAAKHMWCSVKAACLESRRLRVLEPILFHFSDSFLPRWR